MAPVAMIQEAMAMGAGTRMREEESEVGRLGSISTVVIKDYLQKVHKKSPL
jgi:hypothetical protein